MITIKSKIFSIILFSIIYFVTVSSFAQTSFKSRTIEDRCVEMRIRFIENVVVVSKRECNDPNLGMGIFNLTDLKIENGRIEFPLEGKFWFIPFDDGNGQEMMNGGAMCYYCTTTNPCTGGCDWNGSGYCACQGGSSSCTVERCPCSDGGGGIYRVAGGGVIVEANEVRFE